MRDERLIKVFKSLPLFTQTFLKIRKKSGDILPFTLNRAQIYLDERLENQRRCMGYIRAIVLKGRQQGCSTYVQARDFRHVITRRGLRAFILTHDHGASKNLFDMTKGFYEDFPPGLIPKPDTSNAKELKFPHTRSGYSVGTAGNKAVGRSQTIQLFHGSEVGFWQHAEEHATGILQCVPKSEGTEVILESTANGMTNYFYKMWMSAMTGESDFQAIFLPWFWQDEYAFSSEEEIARGISDEEQEMLRVYSPEGLTKEHLYWRRKKLYEFSNDYQTAADKFKTEYPMTAIEAFRNSIEDSFIKPHLVIKARKNTVDTMSSPLVIGVDPAIGDRDNFALIRRRGRMAYGLERHNNFNTMEIVGWLRRIIDKENPVKVCIDCIGLGAGVVDRLHELGYMQVEGIASGRNYSSTIPFVNQRAEMWHDMREWLAQDMGVQIPDRDDLQADLTSLGYRYKSDLRLLIESKDLMRKNRMPSPDSADALALTFAGGDFCNSTVYKPELIPESHRGMFT